MDVVFSIFEQFGAQGTDEQGVLSAFTLPSRPSLVYIEATSFPHALTSLFRSSDGVPLYPGVLKNEVPCIVPVNERLHSLISLAPIHSFTVPSYVLVNEPRSLYHGDVCFACRNEDAEWVEVALVPRIALPGPSICPEAMLFDPHDYPGESFHFRGDGTILWESRKFLFYHGFLLTSYRMTSLTALFVRNPLLSLLCPTIDFDDWRLIEYKEAGFECVGTDFLNLLLAVRRFRSQSRISVGSYVQIFAGDYEGCLGTVRGIQEPNAFLTLLHDSSETSASVPLACMALEVKVGDYVEILTGHHKGRTGLVIERIAGSVTDSTEQLVIVEKATYKQVRSDDFSFVISQNHFFEGHDINVRCCSITP